MLVSIAFKWTYYAHVFSEPKSAHKVNVLHLWLSKQGADSSKKPGFPFQPELALKAERRQRHSKKDIIHVASLYQPAAYTEGWLEGIEDKVTPRCPSCTPPLLISTLTVGSVSTTQTEKWNEN